MKYALPITRSENFSEWYQSIVRDADLAELSPVRGCMVIKPWGYGIWELLQKQLDERIKALGFDNCYFPLFIPMGFIATEAEHVEGFAKEMAVVTHHRLVNIDGKLQVDPEAELEEPLIVRPTSETIIGDSFRRWIQSYRDLPIRINQWANVVRWEMRTRLFLRTTEFLWQEGHSAHAEQAEARESTKKALELYHTFAESVLAIPSIAGEKTENERFPGAENTFSIEAMMQDGKALQAGTSHYLGQHFAQAQNISYQDKDGNEALCFTSSWGMSTRMIGGLIMTHGDDDGLRCPPSVAPKQVVIIPMLRGKSEDAEVMAFCKEIQAELSDKMCLSSRVRTYIDESQARSAEKKWMWIRRGAPVICEVGPRDVASGVVSFLRRDKLRDNARVISTPLPLSEFAREIPDLLTEIQHSLFMEAKSRLDSSIHSHIEQYEDLVNYYGEADYDHLDATVKGWVRCSWSKPTGENLKAIEEKLKTLKLTIRNAPFDQPSSFKPCIFTGEPGVEEIILAPAY